MGAPSGRPEARTAQGRGHRIGDQAREGGLLRRGTRQRFSRERRAAFCSSASPEAARTPAADFIGGKACAAEKRLNAADLGHSWNLTSSHGISSNLPEPKGSTACAHSGVWELGRRAGISTTRQAGVPGAAWECRGASGRPCDSD